MGKFEDIANKQISIGHIKIGDNIPVVLQSMTSTPTMDTTATVNQIIRIVDAGAHLVRITARDIKEAKNLVIIKKELANRGYHIPLIADIHFNPKAANIAAAIVEKVRINPGNYVNKNTGKAEWTNEEYTQDLLKIKNRLKDLVQICKTYKTAIRIGVNHGSLAERVVNKFGNTAEGMAESAMEFIRIFQELEFDHLVISLKASNVIIMVESNRLLVKKMRAENCYFPIHLGVTEAGDAEDGRIKSAVGIGTLLAEYIGDTIRVSLTEDPEFEIPVAKQIVLAAQQNNWKDQRIQNTKTPYQRRNSYAVASIGNKQMPLVIQEAKLDRSSSLKADLLFHKDEESWKLAKNGLPIRKCSIDDFLDGNIDNQQNYYLRITPNKWSDELITPLKKSNHIIIVLEKKAETPIIKVHQLLQKIDDKQITCPLVLLLPFGNEDKETLMIRASVQAGPLLLAGKLDGLWLQSPHFSTTDIAFGILQATRQRISKTEYIACPSCGRTLFNIQEKLQEIKKTTSQFKGLKIAVMGCIVNGPGEMADADFGFVGAGPGKVNIYKGQEILLRNIPEEQATQSLLKIIHLHSIRH